MLTSSSNTLLLCCPNRYFDGEVRIILVFFKIKKYIFFWYFIILKTKLLELRISYKVILQCHKNRKTVALFTRTVVHNVCELSDTRELEFISTYPNVLVIFWTLFVCFIICRRLLKCVLLNIIFNLYT